jgi:hypothetical protein
VVDVGHPAVDLDRRTQEPGDEVEVMDGLVDEDATALAGDRTPPGVHREVLRPAPAQDVDGCERRRPDPAAVDGGLEPLDRLVPASLADHGQDDPGSCGSGHHLLRLDGIECHGLLDDHVQPGSRRGDALLRMEWVGRAQDHRVDIAAVDQRLQARVDTRGVRCGEGRSAIRTPAATAVRRAPGIRARASAWSWATFPGPTIPNRTAISRGPARP